MRKTVTTILILLSSLIVFSQSRFKEKFEEASSVFHEQNMNRYDSLAIEANEWFNIAFKPFIDSLNSINKEFDNKIILTIKKEFDMSDTNNSTEYLKENIKKLETELKASNIKTLKIKMLIELSDILTFKEVSEMYNDRIVTTKDKNNIKEDSK